jgi:hypothetical protein
LSKQSAQTNETSNECAPFVVAEEELIDTTSKPVLKVESPAKSEPTPVDLVYPEIRSLLDLSQRQLISVD